MAISFLFQVVQELKIQIANELRLPFPFWDVPMFLVWENPCLRLYLVDNGENPPS